MTQIPWKNTVLFNLHTSNYSIVLEHHAWGRLKVSETKELEEKKGFYRWALVMRFQYKILIYQRMINFLPEKYNKPIHDYHLLLFVGKVINIISFHLVHIKMPQSICILKLGNFPKTTHILRTFFVHSQLNHHSNHLQKALKGSDL